MSDIDYFWLIFIRLPVTKDRLDKSKADQSFDKMFRDGFAELDKAIRRDFRPDGIVIRPVVYAALSRSLRARLRQLLSPALEHERKSSAAAGPVEFFAKYSYLEQAARQIVDDWRSDTRSFLQRLSQDMEQIHKTAGLTPKPKDKIIKRIRCDLSDRHAGGKTIKIVETSALTFVYKPRPLKAEANFYKWLSALNQDGLRPNLYSPWVMDKQTYGWAEYCRPLTKLGSERLARIYARQYGAICAIWYVLGGTDLHLENILFTDRGVVVIDCETLFEADLYYCSWPTGRVLQRVEPNAAVSAITSTHAFSYLIEDEDKTKDIGGGAQYIGLLKRMPNQPLGYEAFVSIVCRSMGAVFRYFRRQPIPDVLKTINAQFDGTPCRILYRPTQYYGILLHNMAYTHEVLARRSDAYQHLLEQLGLLPSSMHEHLISQAAIKHSEASQMLNSDIPYIARTLGQNRLHIIGSEDVTHKSMDYASVKQRLQWLQEPHFIADETELVKLNLAAAEEVKKYTPTDPGAHNFTSYYRYTQSCRDYLPGGAKNQWHQTLASIAAQVITALKHMNDTGRAYHLCSVPASPKRRQAVPSAYSLFSGVSGNLLFLGAYAAVLDKPRIKHFVRQQSAYFLELVSEASYVSRYNGGLDMGCQGLLYTFEHLRRLGVIYSYPDTLLNGALTANTGVRGHELVDGVSGDALLACFLRGQLPPGWTSGWTERLKHTMRTLLASWNDDQDTDKTGLALGVLGVCLAASKLYGVTQDEELKRLALSLIAAEASLIAAQHAETNGWCKGTAGRALAYYHAGKSFGIPHYVRDAYTMTDLAQKPAFTNHTLCCGSLGFAAAHLYIRNKNAGQDSLPYRKRILNQFYKNPNALLSSRGRPSAEMPANLFYGLSGLGVVMLYCMQPSYAPAPWVVE